MQRFPVSALAGFGDDADQDEPNLSTGLPPVIMISYRYFDILQSVFFVFVFVAFIGQIVCRNLKDSS